MAHQGRVSVTKLDNGYALDEGIVIYRSSYEYKAIQIISRLYKAGRIASWTYETDVFQYIYTIDGKVHKYYMDFTITMTSGVIVYVEVKPYHETVAPKKGKNQSSEGYQRQVETYVKNQDKWNAVEDWIETENTKAKKVLYRFAIWSERELNIGKVKGGSIGAKRKNAAKKMKKRSKI